MMNDHSTTVDQSSNDNQDKQVKNAPIRTDNCNNNQNV